MSFLLHFWTNTTSKHKIVDRARNYKQGSRSQTLPLLTHYILKKLQRSTTEVTHLLNAAQLNHSDGNTQYNPKYCSKVQCIPMKISTMLILRNPNWVSLLYHMNCNYIQCFNYIPSKTSNLNSNYNCDSNIIINPKCFWYYKSNQTRIGNCTQLMLEK